MVDLKKIQDNLKTQDNRITSDPLFVVFQKRKLSANSNFSDSYWYVLDSETSCESVEELREWLRDNLDNDDLNKYNPEYLRFNMILNKEKIMKKTQGTFCIPDYIIEEIAEHEGFEKHCYQEVDIFVTACFTEEGAKDYLRQNQHRLTKPFIYVTSLYRNDEMIGIRELLKNNLIKIGSCEESPMKQEHQNQ